MALVATALASITTLSLTLTVVSLQLASSQYSPRLIEHYLDDRATHAVVSLFLGTFSFAIATLLSTRLPGESGESGAVPSIAISTLVVLAVLSLGALVFFIYRVTSSVRVEGILQRVRDRTLEALRSRPPSDSNDRVDAIPDPPADGTLIRSRRTGFYADLDRELASAFDPGEPVEVWIIVSTGDFVVEGTPVAVVAGPAIDDEAIDTIESWLQFAAERWIESDFSYGVRSLVDVALKALSPGVNDPTTATMAIQRIAEVMAEAGRQHPDRTFTCERGTSVYVQIREWSTVLATSVRQVALYGAEDAAVVLELIGLLRSLAWADSDVDRTDAIREVATDLRVWIDHDVDRVDADRVRIDDAFHALDTALDGRIAPT